MRGICPLYGRMIAATVLRMWKNEEEYDPGRAGSYPDTQRLDDGSIGRADQKTVVRYRIREEYSQHPCLSRPTDHGLEVLRISYAPPKNHKKRWPTQAQMDVVPHDSVENRNANQSRCDGLIFESHLLDEPIGSDRPLLGPSPEHRISIRDCPARTGADARIGESEANGEVRLALRPHGSSFKRRFPYHRQTTI